MTDFGTMSLETVSRLIRQQRASPVEVTESVLERISSQDPHLNAYISVFREQALHSASVAEREIRSGFHRGPLHGVPMGIKDNLSLQNSITTVGSSMYRDSVSEINAGVVDKLLSAGAVILGKHNLHEFALGVTTENPHYGTTLNPWNSAKIAGGSSGGGAAAVASGMSIGTIGSDTSGSIRIPAACCGTVGLKPTYGRVSKYGCFPEAWTLDHVGPMGRSVTDVALILDAIAGYDLRDHGSLACSPTSTASQLSSDVGSLRIGFNESYFFSDVDDSVAEAVCHVLRRLERRGASVIPIDLPELDAAEYALTIIDTSEASTVHRRSLAHHPEQYGDDVRFLLECGLLPSAIDYLEAQQIRSSLKMAVNATFDDVDVFIGPTLPIRTPDVGERESLVNGRAVDTAESLMRIVGLANLLGLPSVSVPGGFVDDMPVGVQIVGAPLGEQVVLDTALCIEQIAGEIKEPADF